jgi:hypothetical protein
MTFMPSRNVHLVGSVPLANAHEVFVTVSAALGRRLLRIPDGETGERSDWIAHLEPVFANHPALEKSDEVFRLHPTAPGRTRYRLKPTPQSARTRISQDSSSRKRSPRIAAFRSIWFRPIR